MATAAGLRLIDARAGWMGRVATDTRAHDTLFGVIGVHALVAVFAGIFRRASHVVRSVAAGTLVVRRDLPAAEHVEIGVTRATRSDGLRLEFVGTMAADALAVSAFEQRRCGNDRLLPSVTRGARRARLAGGRVLVLMAGNTSLKRSFAARSVRGLDALVTIRTRRGARSRVLVRAVTAGALLRTVNGHRRRGALLHGMATLAVAGRVRLDPAQELGSATLVLRLDMRDVERSRVAARAWQLRQLPRRRSQLGVMSAAVERESVTTRAVGLRAMPKALLGLLSRV